MIRTRWIELTLEADNDEDSPEVIREEDDETLDNLYMSPSEVGSAAFVQVDSSWRETCIKHKFCIKATKAFAFSDGYELLLSFVGSRVTDYPIGHVAVYTHMLDFGLRFPLDKALQSLEHMYVLADAIRVA